MIGSDVDMYCQSTSIPKELTFKVKMRDSDTFQTCLRVTSNDEFQTMTASNDDDSPCPAIGKYSQFPEGMSWAGDNSVFEDEGQIKLTLEAPTSNFDASVWICEVQDACGIVTSLNQFNLMIKSK